MLDKAPANDTPQAEKRNLVLNEKVMVETFKELEEPWYNPKIREIEPKTVEDLDSPKTYSRNLLSESDILELHKLFTSLAINYSFESDRGQTLENREFSCFGSFLTKLKNIVLPYKSFEELKERIKVHIIGPFDRKAKNNLGEKYTGPLTITEGMTEADAYTYYLEMYRDAVDSGLSSEAKNSPKDGHEWGGRETVGGTIEVLEEDLMRSKRNFQIYKDAEEICKKLGYKDTLEFITLLQQISDSDVLDILGDQSLNRKDVLIGGLQKWKIFHDTAKPVHDELIKRGYSSAELD